METLDNGAHAYVSKEEGREHLVEAVLAAGATAYVTGRRPGDARRPAPTRPRSEQERQACCCVPGHVESIGRAAHVDQREHVRQYIGARAPSTRPRATAPSKDALLVRAIEDGVIKPGDIMPYKSFARAAADAPAWVPGPVNGRDTQAPGAPPRESAAGRRRAAWPAPRRHQIRGLRTVSIPDRGRRCHDARTVTRRAG